MIIDNSASERARRPSTIGRKNWEFMNTIRGAKASAVIYSVLETARLNNQSSYYYVDHLLTELPKLRYENGNIDTAGLDQLLPWSDTLPEQCCKPRRK
ncbi:MAG: IS66 family transposase [Butyrivibrio sp.]|nr:IS66 family transposase [Butyrivibrio sp.]